MPDIKKKERNFGIELLRVMSMMFIVTIHVMEHGGVLENSIGINYIISHFLYTIIKSGVNCFALISGYVGFSEKKETLSFRKYLLMWMQVVFFSILSLIIVSVYSHNAVSFKSLVKTLFPVTLGSYWYFTAYTMVYFLKPFMNKTIQKLNTVEEMYRAYIYFGLLCILIRFSDIISGSLKFSNGLSWMWLCMMYYLGAMIRKQHMISLENCKADIHRLIKVLLVCILLTWGWKIIFHFFIGFGKYDDLFLVHTSLTMIGEAVCFLLLFAQYEPGKKKKRIISFFSAASFGVYLLHDNRSIRAAFITDQFIWITATPAYLIIIYILGSALCIYIICVIVEKLRQRLFQLLQLPQLSRILSDHIDSVLNHAAVYLTEKDTLAAKKENS